MVLIAVSTIPWASCGRWSFPAITPCCMIVVTSFLKSPFLRLISPSSGMLSPVFLVSFLISVIVGGSSSKSTCLFALVSPSFSFPVTFAWKPSGLKSIFECIV